MLIESADPRSVAQPEIPPIEFLRVQLSPAKDGTFFLAVSTTTVDEPEAECFELVDQEILNSSAANIEDALSVIGEHVRRTFSVASN